MQLPVSQATRNIEVASSIGLHASADHSQNLLSGCHSGADSVPQVLDVSSGAKDELPSFKFAAHFMVVVRRQLFGRPFRLHRVNLTAAVACENTRVVSIICFLTLPSLDLLRRMAALEMDLP